MIKKLYWQKKQDLEVLKRELQAGKVVISSTDTIYGFLANITRDSFDDICYLKRASDDSMPEHRPFLILISRHALRGRLNNFADMASIAEKTLKFIESCWPGPVTFIFKAKKEGLQEGSGQGGLQGVKGVNGTSDLQGAKVNSVRENGSMFDDSIDQLPDFLPKDMDIVEFMSAGRGARKGNGSESRDFLSGGKETIAIRCPNHAGLQDILTNFEGLFSTSANKSGMPAPVKFENIDKNLLDSVNYVVLDVQEGSCERASTIIDLSCPDYTQDFPFGLVREGDFSFVALKEIYKNLKSS